MNTDQDPAPDQDGLSPWVGSQLKPVEDAVRTILRVKPNVRVQVIPPNRDGTVNVKAVLQLPNGQAVTLVLVQTDNHSVLLQFPRHRDAGRGPAVDSNASALAQMFARRQNSHGTADAQRLWSAVDAVGAVMSLDDRYYRRIIPGIHGASANLRLGFVCNQDCHFCWQGRRWPGPPDDMIFRWLDEIGEAGVRRLVLTGGEPTLFRRLPELLHRARHRWAMTTMVQTNAIMLGRETRLQTLVDGGVTRLFVSLHAADPTISDTMTRAPGTWIRTVQGIEASLASGIRVGLSVVVERANLDDLPALAELVVRRFVHPFPNNPMESVTFSRPQTYFDIDHHRESILPLDVLREPLHRTIRTLDAAGVTPDLTTGSCAIPACVLHEMPQHIRLPDPALWTATDRAHDGDRATPVACQGCALWGGCGGPGAGYTAAFGEQGLRPFLHRPANMGTAFDLDWG